jgi:hypothetical protein
MLRISIFVLTALALAGTLLGQETPAEPKPAAAKDDVAEKRIAYLRGRMERYRIFPAGLPERPYTLQEELALRWSNPVSGVVDGGIFVWTDGKRPVVFAKAFINETKLAWGEAVQSVAPGPLVMTLDDREVWTPAGAGVTFHPLDAKNRPAAAAAARLGQMRTLLRQIEAVGIWGEKESSEWSLRLLTTPIHRYASEEEGIVDGAVFALTQGTNPEAIALIEAVKKEDALQWQVAVTRLSQYGSRAKLGELVLADLPRNEKPAIDESYYRGWHWFTRYPFPKSDAANTQP